MHREAGFPLDYGASHYAYIERPNAVLIDLLRRHVLDEDPSARILDIGSGAGANARRIAELAPHARLCGIEPNPSAAALARPAYHEFFEGTFEAWLDAESHDRFDAVLLSDVLEHLVDPVGFLQRVSERPEFATSRLLVSVPNYGVWYNRLRTLAGRFDYTWSGLYDRTHLRFFTRRSLRRLLDYAGFDVSTDACTPSLVQSTAPLLRRWFEQEVARGEHLALSRSTAFARYERFVEPAEQRLCSVWPELFGFQIVCIAKPRASTRGRRECGERRQVAHESPQHE